MILYVENLKNLQKPTRVINKFSKAAGYKIDIRISILLVGIYPNFSWIYTKLKTGIQIDLYIPMFIAVLVIIAKREKQHKCPSTEEGINKMWYIDTMEYCSALKRNEGIIPWQSSG